MLKPAMCLNDIALRYTEIPGRAGGHWQVQQVAGVWGLNGLIRYS